MARRGNFEAWRRRIRRVEAARELPPPLPMNHPLFAAAPNILAAPTEGESDIDYIIGMSERVATWHGLLAQARQIQARQVRRQA